MWRVTNIEKTVIAIGRRANVIQLEVDKFIIAINPTRVLCAADRINNNIGQAERKPMLVADADIFATIICICCATKLSEAPIWFNISNSRLCNIAVLRAMYDMHMPITPSIIININAVISIICVPTVVEAFRAVECGKKRAVLDICFSKSFIAWGVLNFISHMVGR